ncbi:MAG TPA: hypothetical protein PK306_22720 [Aquabacterium sp.]|nr:hypothetical protein [Aquabacterium sp.]HQC98520.1 hypothetical protein [Aquabacterium sp.]
MTFLRPLRRRGLRLLAPLAAAAALLVACGGGTSQVQVFKPARLLVVGDETGMLVDVDGNQDGYRYGLNDRTTAIVAATATTAATAHCQLLPTPAQQVAVHYDMRFKECNPALNDTGERPEPRAHSLGRAGALTEDPATGLKAQVDGISNLGPDDMVVVTIGTNDIIAVYEQRRAGTWATDAQAIAEARRRGQVAADQTTRILATGARALVFNVPVLGKSPYAISAEAAVAGSADLIGRITLAFNAGLQIGIQPQDGRYWGLVNAYDTTEVMERYPASYLSSPANKTDALCTAAMLPQNCLIVTDTDGVAPDTSLKSNTHLWTTDRLIGPVAQLQIGAQAVSRAVNNPF